MGDLWIKIPLTWTEIFRGFYQSLGPNFGILFLVTPRNLSYYIFYSSLMTNLELQRPFLGGQQTNKRKTTLMSVAIRRRTLRRQY